MILNLPSSTTYLDLLSDKIKQASQHLENYFRLALARVLLTYPTNQIPYRRSRGQNELLLAALLSVWFMFHKKSICMFAIYFDFTANNGRGSGIDFSIGVVRRQSHP